MFETCCRPSSYETKCYRCKAAFANAQPFGTLCAPCMMQAVHLERVVKDIALVMPPRGGDHEIAWAARINAVAAAGGVWGFDQWDGFYPFLRYDAGAYRAYARKPSTGEEVWFCMGAFEVAGRMGFHEEPERFAFGELAEL